MNGPPETGPTISALTCPNCGSPLNIAERQSFASCAHCRTAVAISWPQQTIARFVARDEASPVVFCPFCSGQVLRDPKFAEAYSSCPHCGKQAVMPGVPVLDAKHCAVCGRIHFERKCPECARRQFAGRSLR